MNKIKLLVLSLIAGLFPLIFIPTPASARMSHITIINHASSYPGHHLYAYSGLYCDGYRWKLEPTQKQYRVRSFKSPWSMRVTEPLGSSWNLPAQVCQRDAGRFIKSTYSNNLYVVVKKY